MRGGGTLGAAIVVLVALSQVAVSQGGTGGLWNQLGGGPDRAGVYVPPPGPLDVLASYRILKGTEAFSMQLEAGIAVGPAGLVGVAAGDPDDANGPDRYGCVLVRVPDPTTGSAIRVPLDDCPPRFVAGYDTVRGALLVCADAGPDRPLLSALDPTTGEASWTVSPADLNLVSVDGPGGLDETWHCRGAAIDVAAREAVLPVHSFYTTRNRIASVSLDTGDVNWVASIHPSMFFAGATPPSRLESGGFQYTPEAVTLTTEGIVVQGMLVFNAEQSVKAFAWLDREGTVFGGVAAEGNPEQAPLAGSGGPSAKRTPAASEFATAAGALAIAVVGDRVVLINPTSPDVVSSTALSTIEPTNRLGLWPTPRWWQGTVLVPLAHSVAAHEAGDLSARWAWRESLRWVVSDVLVAPPGDAYVLAARETTEGAEAALFRLDLTTGAAVQRLALPVVPGISRIVEGVEGGGAVVDPPSVGIPRWPARLLPLPGDGGLLAVDQTGQVALLGTAPASTRPSLEISTLFPVPSERVTLRPEVSDGSEPAEFLVHWGEGPIESVAPGGEATHQYATPGLRNLRVTAVLPGGRTATSEQILDVGGLAPADLTFMQTAFAPDNEDTTWGVIGLVLVVLGSVVTVGRTWHRRNKLERELRRLQAIQLRSTEDLPAAIKAVDAYRAALQDAFKDGKFDDAQFSVLELRVQRLARAFRHRLLAPFEHRLSPGYHRLLETALEDGILTDAESRMLRERLAHEKRIDAGERAELERLLSA